MKTLSKLGLLAIPVLGLGLTGCGGGSSSGGPSTPTGTVEQGQNFLQTALDAASGGADPSSDAVRGPLQSAVAQFQGAVNANPSSSEANAGLAVALFAQGGVENANNPLFTSILDSVRGTTGPALLGVRSAVALKSSQNAGILRGALTAPLKSAQAIVPSRKASATASEFKIGELQSFFDNTEIPRQQRIVAALTKVNKASSFKFKLYDEKDGETVKPRYLYGPDFQMIEGVSHLLLGVTSTLVGYDLNPGTAYNNTSLKALDVNKDLKITPAEYVVGSSFGKLRSNGESRLNLALSELVAAQSALQAGVDAQIAFVAPADAAIRLTPQEKADLNESKSVLTQAKTVLTGTASYPLFGATRSINLPEFYKTPASDLRNVLPTLICSDNGSKYVVTGYNSATDKTFSGVFPGGSDFLWENLASDAF